MHIKHAYLNLQLNFGSGGNSKNLQVEEKRQKFVFSDRFFLFLPPDSLITSLLTSNIKLKFHMKFSPHIFSCFLLLAESHATLHAWPEYDYCAINPFTCAVGKDTMLRIQRDKEAFGTDHFAIPKIDHEAGVEKIPFAL